MQPREAVTNSPNEDHGERSRSSRRKAKKEEKSFPWVYKALMVVIMLFVSLFIGLFVGYSVVGNGESPEAFSLDTYKHLYDLVFKTNS